MNGPNLSRLGRRQPEVYGSTSLVEVEQACADHARALGHHLDEFQSNHEGALIDRIEQRDYDAIVINPGALTHTSYALHDALVVPETALLYRCDTIYVETPNGGGPPEAREIKIGVVDGNGRILWGDQLMALLARSVLAGDPGATVIADVKASQVLFDEIEKLGGRAVMTPTGHSIIKTRMAEMDAPLAGEMSGHIFFADGYYGFDDGVYAAVRLLNAVAASGKSSAALRDALPQVVNTPEIRIEVPDSRKFFIVDEVRGRLAGMPGVSVNDIDGARVTNSEGWWLLRASNTQNALVVRCEAADEVSLESLKEQVRGQLRESGVEPPDF